MKHKHLSLFVRCCSAIALIMVSILWPRCIHSRGYNTRGRQNSQALYRRLSDARLKTLLQLYIHRHWFILSPYFTCKRLEEMVPARFLYKLIGTIDVYLDKLSKRPIIPNRFGRRCYLISKITVGCLWLWWHAWLHQYTLAFQSPQVSPPEQPKIKSKKPGNFWQPTSSFPETLKTTSYGSL